MIWTILGISVAIIAVFCITVAETLVGQPVFESHRHYLAGALGALGLLAVFLGRHLHANRGAQQKAEADLAKTFLLLDLRYWGPMLLVLSIITLFIRPLRHIKTERTTVASKPSPKQVEKVAPAPPVAIVTPKAPIVFPVLKIQGLIFREQGAYVIINGHSYTVGDHIGDVLVTAIDRERVVVELAGEMRQLTLQ